MRPPSLSVVSCLSDPDPDSSEQDSTESVPESLADSFSDSGSDLLSSPDSFSDSSDSVLSAISIVFALADPLEAVVLVLQDSITGVPEPSPAELVPFIPFSISEVISPEPLEPPELAASS